MYQGRTQTPHQGSRSPLDVDPDYSQSQSQIQEGGAPQDLAQTEAQAQAQAARQPSVGPQPGDGSRIAKTRAKRGKYISRACNECKRRKSKCNGQRPCGRCVQHSLDCAYSRPSKGTARSNGSSTTTMQSLSDLVAEMQEQLRNERRQPTLLSPACQNNDSHTDPASASAPVIPTPPVRPLSQHTAHTASASASDPGAAAGAGLAGSTIHAHTTPPSITPLSMSQTRQPTVNYTFNLELAHQHLRAQGARLNRDAADTPLEATRPGSPADPTSFYCNTPSGIDPLWLIDKEEALRLCHVYEEEIGISYPVMTLSGLIDNVHRLYDAMEAGARNGFAFSSLPGPAVIHADDLDILRLAMSTALCIETSGPSDLGNTLFAKAQDTAAGKLWQPVTLKSIAIYTLIATHVFLAGDDLQAWRVIGLPARWCLELGLHQATTFGTKFKQPGEKRMAIRLFWSVHTLDRRWSFGAGLPFVIQSNDIDPNLPMPDDDVPYLQAMVSYNRIGAKVWAALYNSNNSAATSVAVDEVDYLHYSIDRWYREIPEGMKLHQPDRGSLNSATGPPPPGRGLHRLQLLLYLRACQMKILLHQSALHNVTHQHSVTNRDQARELVKIAQDMIRKLDHLNKTTDIYQTQQVCFNHFLISALGVIYLAVVLEPAVYRNVVHSEFNMALDLVRGFSKSSCVSRRLWRMIRDLRQAGVRLGLPPGQQQQLDERGAGTNQHMNNCQQPSSPPPSQAQRPAPAKVNNMLTAAYTSFPPSPGHSQVGGPSQQPGDTWLNGGEMWGDRSDTSFIMPPLGGTPMTSALHDLLAAIESESGILPSGLGSGDGESMNGTRVGIESASDNAGDISRIDFTQMWDNFL